MLLRSPSSPLLSSWMKDSSSPESHIIIPKTITSSSLTPSPNPNRILRASSEQNLKDLPKSKTKLFPPEELCSGAMSGESMVVEGAEEECAAVLVDGGGFSSNAGRLCGGGGGGSEEEKRWGSDNHGYDTMDWYYQKMIKANPTNPLLLHNYAKFLKEVKGEYEKAEEYCGRAILANANDGEILCLYGELMWDVHKDAERSESYFNRALQAAPDDCYIMASYARCLWDAEDEDDEEDDRQIVRETSENCDLNGSSSGLPIASELS